MPVLAAFFLVDDLFWQQVITGLATGSIYALVALAIVLIYRSTHVINFAQGEMAMFTTFVAWSLLFRLDYWLAFILVLLLAAALGAFLERAIIRPVEGKPVLTIIIVTLGLFAIFNAMAGWVWGRYGRVFEAPVGRDPVDIGAATVSRHDLVILGMALGIMIALHLFFQYTKTGLAMRATAQNPVASRLMGIRVGNMLTLGWALSATVGAVGGMLVAPMVFLSPTMMLAVLLYAFAAAILGGIDSPLGAVVGGLIIGVVENLAGTYWIGSELKLPFALLVIVLVLMVRPTGLFGRRAVQRV